MKLKQLYEMRMAPTPEPIVHIPADESGVSLNLYRVDDTGAFLIRRAMDQRGARLENRGNDPKYERWIVLDDAGNNKEIHMVVADESLPLVALRADPDAKGLLTNNKKERRGRTLVQIVYPLHILWRPENIVVRLE